MRFGFGGTVAARLRLGNARLGCAQRSVAVEHEIQRAACQGWGFLGDMSDAPLRGYPYLAGISVELALHQREQARLAGTVGSDQTHALTGLDRCSGDVEQRLATALEREIFEDDHGQRRARKKARRRSAQSCARTPP